MELVRGKTCITKDNVENNLKKFYCVETADTILNNTKEEEKGDFIYRGRDTHSIENYMLQDHTPNAWNILSIFS